jgi:hypothetical protein
MRAQFIVSLPHTRLTPLLAFGEISVLVVPRCFTSPAQTVLFPAFASSYEKGTSVKLSPLIVNRAQAAMKIPETYAQIVGDETRCRSTDFPVRCQNPVCL